MEVASNSVGVRFNSGNESCNPAFTEFQLSRIYELSAEEAFTV